MPVAGKRIQWERLDIPFPLARKEVLVTIGLIVWIAILETGSP